MKELFKIGKKGSDAEADPPSVCGSIIPVVKEKKKKKKDEDEQKEDADEDDELDKKLCSVAKTHVFIAFWVI